MYELKMPKFGLTMEEGVITKWYKKEGDFVNKGEAICEIESEKIVNDLESPVSGYIKQILVKEGESKKVGEVIALISESKEELRKEVIKEESEKEILASPRAKRLAKEKGVDLTKIKGSGPGGRIVEKDILDYLESVKESKEIIEELSQIRKEIIKNLKKGYENSILVTNVTKVDFSHLMNIKRNFLKEISVTSILVKVVSQVLKKHPKFNSNFDGEKLIKFRDINIGIATDTEKGLIVPVLKNVENMSIEEIDKKLKDLIKKAKDGKLSIDETKGSHFTITNLGMMRTDFFTPILNANEVGILGIGRIDKEIKMDENGRIYPIEISHLSLSYDHRVIDGADAARFLDDLCSIIENESNLKKLLNL
ncbi:MAG: dihydrolipoamide acetyltransferase family protein [Caldisericia bacterium]|jgi:pyruvate dehydrogenase E2 component (dihydrolipoamide acetyltransferase)|nr:dihydrolipoamide acetyltransferase family protein [Caldisericia bacterium]